MALHEIALVVGLNVNRVCGEIAGCTCDHPDRNLRGTGHTPDDHRTADVDTHRNPFTYCYPNANRYALPSTPGLPIYA